MTESEWLSCGDPQKMLLELRGRTSQRKLRLFACACCRRVWRWLRDSRSQQAVAAAEQYADGLIDTETLYLARVGAETVAEDCAAEARDANAEALASAAFAALNVLRENGEQAAEYAAANTASTVYHAATAQASPAAPARATEHASQAKLLAEIVRNPYRFVALSPTMRTWKGGTVEKIAQAIYNDRAFDRLPILADALEDSGCDNADILAHCRGGGEHVLGCWVVDQILGKR
jgi:hypothetical protein